MKRTLVIVLFFLLSSAFIAGAEEPENIPAGQPATPRTEEVQAVTTPTAMPPQPTTASPTLRPLLTPLAGVRADQKEQKTPEATGREKDELQKPEAPTAPPLPKKPVTSPIEKALTEESQTAQNAKPQTFAVGPVTQFGYNFFRTGGAGFAPLTDIPVGPDYMIGVGDKIVVTLWGSIEGVYEQEVNRNGEIHLPKVGTVKIAGVTFGDLQQVIRTHLATVFKDFQLTVNIGKLRMIKVYLVGEVNSPGDYNLSSLATLINALSAAGGPTKNGSLRNIQVKRNGKPVETVDLYDFFLSGDKSRDIRLQSGDTIFVPTLGPVAGIAGNVRKPAIFELRGEKTLKDLLGLAGGINPSGYLQRVQISRIVAHEKKVVSDFNLDPSSTGKGLDDLLNSVKIQDMDMVKVFPIDTMLRGYVRLEGYVLRPGNYALRPGMRIKDLLPQDNLLPEYNETTAEVTRLLPPDYHPEKLFFSPGKALTGDPAHNMALQEFDEVRLYSRWEMEERPTVKINGEVRKPGEYQLYRNLTLRDLLIMAGNPKLTAYLKNAEITRIDRTGEGVTARPINVNLEEAMKGNPEHNIVLQPFDEVYIRKIPNWAEKTARYVTLKGEFTFPGVYPIFKGERLSSILKRAGGFTDNAYLRAAKFTRASIREIQQKRMDEAIVKAEKEIIQKQSEIAATASSKEEIEGARVTLENLKRTIEQLKQARAEGRLIIKLENLDKFTNGPYDIELQGGDELEVPQTPNSVNVIGQVFNPISLIPIKKQDVGYYLNKAGGPTKDADESEMYVVKADGTVVSQQQISWLKYPLLGGFESVKLEAGDTLVVPQQFDKTPWMRDIKDIATILGQIALAAGVVVAAGL